MCAEARVNIAIKNIFGVVEYICRVIRENYFDVLPEAFVIFNIVHTCKRVNRVIAELRTKILLVEAVAVRIYTLVVKQLRLEKSVADLVGRVRKLNVQLLG